MHISFVSSSIKNSPCSEIFQSLSSNDATVQKVTTMESLTDKNIAIDLAFFDSELGEKNILQQVHLYHQKNEKMKWLVTHLYDVQQSLQYIQAGTSGVFTNPCDIKNLQHSIQSVSAGQLYLQDNLIQILALRQIKKTLHPFNQLTAREFDVFCLLSENYSIQELAKILSITIKTAFNCQTQLRKKLNLENQKEVVVFAKQSKLML